MGCDIHWIAERQHSDGKWEAAFSQDHCYFLAENCDLNAYWNSVQSDFGDRNYEWFGLLSNVRGSTNDLVDTIAQEGLPADASEHSATTFNENSGDLHTHGHFTLAHLKSVRDQLVAHPHGADEYEKDIKMIVEYLSYIDQMIKDEGPVSIMVDNILFGASRDKNYETTFPDMAAESNHAQVARKARIAGLLPISDTTLRFIVAYDS